MTKTLPSTVPEPDTEPRPQSGCRESAPPLSDLEAARTVEAKPDSAERSSDGPPLSLRPQELSSLWSERGIDVTTVRTDHKGTVLPTKQDGQRSYPDPPREVMKALPTLQIADPGPQDVEFELGPTLGRGGMGVVKTARQTTLGREVAIKTVLPEVTDPDARPQLLFEARVTGALEHPNVVPIHAIGRDEQGQPFIVMKRIEGRTWRELITEAEAKNEAKRSQLLRRHLSVLLQVARAVHFAHSRGILHRDLKPENVMIGEFGEVYVVDWGIAVALDERAPAGLPKAEDMNILAGTPAYMAPEMAAADGSSLSERTDVYLLGALLHELITGKPPHGGRTVIDTIRRAFTSKPHDYGASVPRPLADICHRAMSWDPNERYADAGAFALAIDQFVETRNSTALSHEASQRLEKLQRELDRTKQPTAEQLRSVRSLFSEIRFAFAHARKAWPKNREAAQGLQAALELMVDFELRNGAASAAAALVAELPEPRPKLVERVDRAIEERRQTKERLQKLEHDADLSIGDRMRLVVVVCGSLFWCLCCVGTGVLRRYELYPVSQLQFGLICAVFGALLGLTAYLGRRGLYANVVTRRITQTSVLVFAMYAVLWPMAHLLRIETESTAATSLLISCALWLSLGLHVQRAFAGMAVGTALALVATWLWPRFAFEWMGLGGVLGGAVVASWQRRQLPTT